MASMPIQLRSVDMEDTDKIKYWNDLETRDLEELSQHQNNHFVAFDQGTWETTESENKEHSNVADGESSNLGKNSIFLEETKIVVFSIIQKSMKCIEYRFHIFFRFQICSPFK